MHGQKVTTPDFVLKLRELVGFHRLQLVSVSGVVYDSARGFLLGQRVDTKLWACISGVLEPDEQPDECLRREFMEETGAEVKIVSLLNLHVEPVTVYPNGDTVQFLNLVFYTKLLSDPAVVDNNELLQLSWFFPSNFPKMTPENLRRLKTLGGFIR